MVKINWTFQSMEDLESIASHLESISPKYASYLIELFFQEVKVLEQFPNIGRKVPETNIDSIREIIIKKYRIIYSTTSQETVDILAVRHSSYPLDEDVS